MKKKLLSLTMALSIMATMGTSVFASDSDVLLDSNILIEQNTSYFLENADEETFVYPDGSIVKYYLDEFGVPYIKENEMFVPVMLPLEHLKITDSQILEEINSSISTRSNTNLGNGGLYSVKLSSSSNTTPELTLSSSSKKVYVKVGCTDNFTLSVLYKNSINNTWYAIQYPSVNTYNSIFEWSNPSPDYITSCKIVTTGVDYGYVVNYWLAVACNSSLFNSIDF